MVLKEVKPQIWMVQETKLKPNEKIKCESLNDYQVFYLNRQQSQGGGIALGVAKDLESTLIREGNDETEAMSVLVSVGKLEIRVLTAYCPQENATNETKEKIWEFFEEEVNKADIEGQGLILQMDGNLHAGDSIVKNDPNSQNRNGKIFENFLNRNPSITVVNGLDICEGLITRERHVKDKKEKAVLDFFLVNEKIRPLLRRMVIDEEKKYVLSNLAQINKNKCIIETDHNSEILELEFRNRKPEREEILNLQNKACQEVFKDETEHNLELLEVFEKDVSLEIQSRNYFKVVNNILHKSFRKVRIGNNRKKGNHALMEILDEKAKLKTKVNDDKIDEITKKLVQDRIEQIETNIANEIIEENRKVIMDTSENLNGEKDNLGGAGQKQMWKILKKKYPKTSPDVPVGKKDKSGNLITNHKGSKQLYLETYMHRLRNRPIKKDFEEIEELKNKLFSMRLKISQNKKSKTWNMKDLESVLKELKPQKARDPNGWINEIFSSEVAGKNLKISMLKLFNKMKEQNFLPQFLRKADVATIYK